MMQDMKKNSYLLLDSRDGPLACGLLISQPDDPNWQVQVLDGKVEKVLVHEEIQMLPIVEKGPALLGRIIQHHDDMLVMEKLQCLDTERRQNLRVPTDFKSFLYPISGRWRGRRRIEARDLSSGGIAFYCANQLAVRESAEVVIPVTEQPLILRCSILRQRPTDREGLILYAAQFTGMCPDEETMVREAVFHIQLHGRPRAG